MRENHLPRHLKDEKATNKKIVLEIIMQSQNFVLVMLFDLKNEKNKIQRSSLLVLWKKNCSEKLDRFLEKNIL